MKTNLLLLLFLLPGIAVQGQDMTVKAEKKLNFVQLCSEYSYLMLEPVQDLRKIDVLQSARKKGLLQKGNLYVGASVISLVDYQQSNTDSKFGYLMRHPTASNQIGKTVSEAVIHSAQLGLTGVINNWLAAHLEILYDPQQSFGAGTITTLTRNQLQLRKGYVLIGNPEKFPVYGAIGKMDAPFGLTGSVNPFTNSTLWHAFGGLGYGALVRFNKYGINASFMAVQGGAQFRALHTPVEGTNIPSRLNNFVADLNYTIRFTDRINLLVGASYLHGSTYCQGFPVFHFMPCEDNNPASTFYGKLNYKNKLILKGGYAITGDVWPGTFNPTPPLNEFAASKVSSMEAGLKFIINPAGKVVYSLSGEFSNFVAGPDGAPWERQTQTVIGFSGLVNHSSKLFFEFFRTTGYAPLNFISGGSSEDLSVTHSDADANSFGLVLGALLTI